MASVCLEVEYHGEMVAIAAFVLRAYVSAQRALRLVAHIVLEQEWRSEHMSLFSIDAESIHSAQQQSGHKHLVYLLPLALIAIRPFVLWGGYEVV